MLQLRSTPLDESWGRICESCKLFLLGQGSQVFLSPKQTSTAHRGVMLEEQPWHILAGEQRQGCDCKDKVCKYKMQLHLLSTGRKLRQLLL